MVSIWKSGNLDSELSIEVSFLFGSTCLIWGICMFTFIIFWKGRLEGRVGVCWVEFFRVDLFGVGVL